MGGKIGYGYLFIGGICVGLFVWILLLMVLFEWLVIVNQSFFCLVRNDQYMGN